MIDYRQLVTLTHPLLQFVCWCQELHEEFMLDWVQVFSEVVCNIIGRFNIIGSIHVKKEMHIAGVVGDAIVAAGRSVTEGTVHG